MKLGLIGANGKVGTELCFLLKNDVDLKPIIRNRLGSVFLKHHGFSCTIADISQNKDSKECLADIDAVVISSYATDPFSGSQTQSSQKINEQIIKNSVKFSDKDATIIYFSTIRAFSHKIDPNTSHFWTIPGYDKEKKHLERVFMSECRKNKKRGFALRLGHVFGYIQPRTEEFKKIFSKKRISVRVSSDKKSNVVHVIAIKDAIMRCLDPKTKPNVYVSTPITAAIKSFSKMRINKIAVLTPYPKLVNETIFNFLAKQDIEITSFSSFNLEYDNDIANVDPQHLLETINNLEHQNADAIFVSCTALRAVEILDQAERDTSKFVISSNQALIWDTIRSVNINSNINGYGKLFLN